MTPPAVRILPMSSDEFDGQSTQQVQSEFFLKELPSHVPGRYYYRTSGLSAEPGTIVLFQYANAIIASAIFNANERFDQPDGDYHGALLFDTGSIRTFTPVDSDSMSSVWGEGFSGFGRVKASLNPEKYPNFENCLSRIQTPSESGA